MKRSLHLLITMLLMCIIGVMTGHAQSTYTVSFNNNSITQSTEGWFDLGSKHSLNAKYTGTYDGVTYTTGLKMESATTVKFTTTANATITIVQSTSANGTNTFKFDGTEVPQSEGTADADNTVIVYTKSIADGEHSITRNKKEIGILFIKVVQEASTQPTLTLNPATINLNAYPFNPTVSTTFMLSGENLTAGDYNLNVPTVDGLTVSPTAFTVGTDGKCNQQFTITYEPTKDTEAATATISATVGTLSDNITVNYSALVTATEQRTVAAATTWDFSKTGLTSFDKVSDPVLYANIGAKTSDDFAADAMTYVGQYPVSDNGTACRVNTKDVLAFKTSTAGTITVTFCNTGGNGDRYLTVNGTKTSYSEATGKADVTTDPISVEAGDVTIGGDNSIKIKKIVFEPAVSELSIVVKEGYSNYATFYSTKGYTLPEGLAAYTISGIDDNNKVVYGNTYNAGDAVPAKTAVLVKATAAGTYTASVNADAAEFSGTNLLNGSETSTAVNEAGYMYYVLTNDANNANTGFYWQKGTDGTSVTTVAGRAYLKVTKAQAAKGFSFPDETTGISAVSTSANSLNDNAEMYNLAGQRVTKAYKGVVIQNGKKFINK
ncbi:hypothetical protein [Prevotella lacticifex]|uniref:hypothetical protein n=1 Tax=Prevotella lacticifex TaxID=2854755 RepID=UPI001CC492DC|nr:hypothetical protein [Prevotella lacticifex]